MGVNRSSLIALRSSLIARRDLATRVTEIDFMNAPVVSSSGEIDESLETESSYSNSTQKSEIHCDELSDSSDSAQDRKRLITHAKASLLELSTVKRDRWISGPFERVDQYTLLA